jgi:integrase
MRVKLKGIHTVSKTLSDGKIKSYHYAWRGGPRLDGKPGSPEFMASYNQAVKDHRKPPQGELQTLIYEWKTDAHYLALSAASKRNYALYTALIEDKFGDMPIAALNDRGVRLLFKEWRSTMAATPRKADYAMVTLAKILAFAKDNARITANHAEKMGRLYVSKRAAITWSDEEIELVLAKADPTLSRVVILALATGLRQGDMLKLTWANYDGKALRLIVSKTVGGVKIPVRVTIPLLDYAREMLDAMPRAGDHIFTNQRGKPWGQGFGTSWKKARRKMSGDINVHFNDLRGTAITRLKLAGCSDPEIASITGHKERTVGQVLAAHYLGDTTALAERAISRLDSLKKERVM